MIALFATGIATVALAVLAFDLAGYDLGAVLGTALSIKMLAYVVAAPVSAALTERLPRKQLLIALDLIRAASLGVLPLVSEVTTIYALVFVFALASATFTLVYMSVVPYLLGDETHYAQSLARSRRQQLSLGPGMDGSRMARGAMIFWLLVGCGYVFSVSFAVCPRALMNVCVRSGPYQWHALEALRSERGVPSSFPSVCSHLTLPSPFRSGRLRPEVQSGHAARQSAPVLSIAQTARTMRMASAMAATLSGFLAIMPPSQSVPGSDFFAPGDDRHGANVDETPDVSISHLRNRAKPFLASART